MFDLGKKKTPADLRAKDVKEVLKEFKELKEEFTKVSEELQEMKKQNKMSIQKVGIIRYNPFSNTGSDLSFSVALLDGGNNGIVVTSLYSREGNRVYGKAVKNAKSEHSLSEEEQKAIKEAIKNE